MLPLTNVGEIAHVIRFAIAPVSLLTGESENLQLRQQDFVQMPADAYAVLWSAAVAKSIYGVVMGDAKATEAERDRQRMERIGGKPTGKKLSGTVGLRPTENLAVRGGRWSCAKCATDLGPMSKNYKEGCVRVDRPIEACNPIVGDPARYIDPRPQFRQFCCPGCGLLVENEIAVAEEPLLVELELSERPRREGA